MFSTPGVGLMEMADSDHYRHLNEKGHSDFDPDLPWWVCPRFELSTVNIEPAKIIKFYCRHTTNGFEYAYVEWRTGTAYLFGLYLNGKDLTPPQPRIVTAMQMKKFYRRKNG